MKYLPKNIDIKIYISQSEIESDGYINLYDITESGEDDPSKVGSEGTLIAKVNSTLPDSEPDPSLLGNTYLFTHRYTVNKSQTYDFEYFAYDGLGNIGNSNVFEQQACLVPVVPIISDPSFENSTVTFTISQ